MQDQSQLFDEVLNQTFDIQRLSVDLLPLHFNPHPEGSKRVFPYTGLNKEKPYYLCHTGLHKRIYRNVLGISSTQYSKAFYLQIHPSLIKLVTSYGYYCICYLIDDDSKQIILLFQAQNTYSVTPHELAERIDSRLQILYRQYLPGSMNVYCNTTALSSELSGTDGISQGFKQTQALKKLSFFLMRPGVLTQRRLDELKISVDYLSIMRTCQRICTAFSHGDTLQTLALNRELFLSKLKYCFDFEIVRNVLSHFKYEFSIRSTIYEIHLFDPIVLCNPDSYITIEECHQSIENALVTLCEAVQQNGVYSSAIVLAAYYICAHLQENISLQEISEYADLSLSRLSTQFHHETGVTIKQYQTHARVKRALFLLDTTDMLISEIAAQCGFVDRRYFTSIFKTQTGMTPQEYRLSKA